MMDELSKIAEGLRSLAPAPDPALRARALARAMENFDRARAARGAEAALAEERARGFAGFGLWLRGLMARPALATTSSLAAVALGAALILPLVEVPQRGTTILSSPPGGEARDAAGEESSAASLSEVAPPAAEMSRKAARSAEPAPAAAALSEQPGPGGWESLATGLELGYWPGPGQINAGALINAFDYAPGTEAPGEGFAGRLGVQPAPWDGSRQLVSVILTGPAGGDADPPELSVEWNPEKVQSHRLLGHDSRVTDAQSLQMTALYELVPVADPPLPEGDLGVLRLAGTATDLPGPLWEREVTGRETADGDQRFMAAIAGFALILQSDDAVRGWSLTAAADLAEAGAGADPAGARAEAVRLIRLADRQPD